MGSMSGDIKLFIRLRVMQGVNGTVEEGSEWLDGCW